MSEPVNAPEPRPTADRHGLTPYRSRFGVLYLALAVIAGIAVGGLIVSLGRGEQSQNTTPTKLDVIKANDRGEIGAQGLAEEVQRRYTLGPNEPLVNVVASRNTLQDGQLNTFRVRYQLVRDQDATFGEDSRLIVLDNAIQYSLCGAARACAIPGQASADRLTLLRRMGLELALRTMRMDSRIGNVAIFLRPVPPPDNTDGYVMMFERSRLEAGWLKDPLAKVLPGGDRPLRPGALTLSESQRIDKATRRHLYIGVYQFVGGRDPLLQLVPVPPQ
jgi:hypothetical protein